MEHKTNKQDKEEKERKLIFELLIVSVVLTRKFEEKPELGVTICTEKMGLSFFRRHIPSSEQARDAACHLREKKFSS